MLLFFGHTNEFFFLVKYTNKDLSFLCIPISLFYISVVDTLNVKRVFLRKIVARSKIWFIFDRTGYLNSSNVRSNVIKLAEKIASMFWQNNSLTFLTFLTFIRESLICDRCAGSQGSSVYFSCANQVGQAERSVPVLFEYLTREDCQTPIVARTSLKRDFNANYTRTNHPYASYHIHVELLSSLQFA